MYVAMATGHTEEKSRFTVAEGGMLVSNENSVKR